MTQLVMPALFALGALQLLLLLLARALGRPLRVEIVAAGLLLPVVLLAPWIDQDKVLAPGRVIAHALPERLPVPEMGPHVGLNDAVYQLLPWELEVRRAFAERRLPLWSDLLEGGSALWSNPQAQVLSPLTLLARAAPLRNHLLLALALKLLVACQGAWVLARFLGCGRAAALIASLCFALGGGILAWALFPLSTAAAWAPWVVAATLALVRRPDRRRFTALAVTTATLLLSGHPEVALAAIALAVVVGLWFVHRGVSSVRRLGAAALAGAIGCGLAAPVVVPFALAAQDSLRAGERLDLAPPPFLSAHRDEWFTGGSGRMFRGPFSPLAFGRPYGPHFDGPWAWPVALSSYTGLAATLGAAAVLASRPWRRALPLVAFAAAALVLSSHFVLLEALLYRLPPLRMPELSRFLPIGCLALSVAGGLGWEALRRGGALPRVAATLAALAAVAVSPTTAVIALAAAFVAAALLRRRKPFWALALAATAVLLDLVPWGRAQLPRDPATTFYPPVPALQRVATELAAGPWRATGAGFHVYPSLLPVYGIAEVRPHNPLAPRAQLRALEAGLGFSPDSLEYFSRITELDHPLLDFLSVRVVVSGDGTPPAPGLVPMRARRGPLRFYRNLEAVERWFLPAGLVVVAPDRVLDAVSTLPHGRHVVVAATDLPYSPLARAQPRAAVRHLRAEPGRVDLVVGGVGDRLLATSLPGPVGWRARAGDAQLATLAVNGAFLGVFVPASAEEVELRYVPPGLTAGCLAALGAALALAAVLWQRRPRGA